MEPSLETGTEAEETSPRYRRRPIVLPIGQILSYSRVILCLCVGLLLFVGWLLQLIGITVSADRCDSYRFSDGSPTGTNCNDIFRGFWWAWFFQFALSIGIAVSLLLNVLPDLRALIRCFLTLSTLQMMERTEEALDMRHDYDIGKPLKVAIAGFILSTIANFLLICAMAVHKTRRPMISTFELDTPELQQDA